MELKLIKPFYSHYKKQRDFIEFIGFSTNLNRIYEL